MTFGEPGAATAAAIEAIGEVDRLEAPGLRIIEVDVHDRDDRQRGSRWAISVKTADRREKLMP